MSINNSKMLMIRTIVLLILLFGVGCSDISQNASAKKTALEHNANMATDTVESNQDHEPRSPMDDQTKDTQKPPLRRNTGEKEPPRQPQDIERWDLRSTLFNLLVVLVLIISVILVVAVWVRFRNVTIFKNRSIGSLSQQANRKTAREPNLGEILYEIQSLKELIKEQRRISVEQQNNFEYAYNALAKQLDSIGRQFPIERSNLQQQPPIRNSSNRETKVQDRASKERPEIGDTLNQIRRHNEARSARKIYERRTEEVNADAELNRNLVKEYNLVLREESDSHEFESRWHVRYVVMANFEGRTQEPSISPDLRIRASNTSRAEVEFWLVGSHESKNLNLLPSARKLLARREDFLGRARHPALSGIFQMLHDQNLQIKHAAKVTLEDDEIKVLQKGIILMPINNPS